MRRRRLANALAGRRVTKHDGELDIPRVGMISGKNTDRRRAWCCRNHICCAALRRFGAGNAVRDSDRHLQRFRRLALAVFVAPPIAVPVGLFADAIPHGAVLHLVSGHLKYSPKI